ncbi:MAG: T9SS type A sorting domain-containing protein [Bacteroidia bacterium]
MKKSIIIFVLLVGYKISNAQIVILANGPTDVCYPNTVQLSVSAPQPGYDYYWYFGGMGCPFQEPAILIGIGTSYTVAFTGLYNCIGVSQNGGPTEIGNDVPVRVLQSYIAMPAPGLYSGTTSCVTSASLCIPDVFYANYPGTVIKWYKNNVVINGASAGSYIATSDGYYKYSITSGCSAMSDSTHVTTLPSAAISTNGSTTFCSGGNVVLNAPVAANRNYQWKKNGTNISGATSQSYVATTGGNYRVTVTNTLTGCSRTSGNATVVTVNALPTAIITPQGSTTFCAGGSVQLNGNPGTGLTYKWKKGSNYISGGTLAHYTATTAGNYRVQVTNNNGCSKISTPVTVTVPCKEGEELMSSNEFNVSVFPNPLSSSTTISFSPGQSGKVLLKIFDLNGRLIETLTDNVFGEGEHSIEWNAEKINAGIYFLQVQSTEFSKTEKLIVTN